MELKDIVCSLEHAKRLKELGVNQRSLFYWARRGIYIPGFSKYELEPDTIIFHKDVNYLDDNACSAFTASELGIIIGESIPNGDEIKIEFYKSLMNGKLNSMGLFYKQFHFYSEMNEADMRASLLIRLIENGLVEVNA